MSRLLDTPSPRLRAAALTPLAALAMHQMGHGDLDALAAPIAASVAILVGLFFARPWTRRGFTRLALLIAAALLALYCGQELLEGALSGRLEGFAGVFGEGGWLAVPVSLAFGALIAAALRGARAVIRWAARRLPPEVSHGRPTPAARPRRVALPSLVPLAAAAAGRAPPLVVSAH